VEKTNEGSAVSATRKGSNLELLIKIKPISGVPLYRILADAIRESIKEQQLPRGQRLPSSRALSKQYKLSISTVLRAYEELCSQGIVVTSAKSGSRVSARFDCSPIVPENPAAEVQAAVRLSQYARHLSHSERLTSPPREAGIMIPSVDYLPTSAWQRLIIKNLHCYEHDTDLYDYSSDPFGYAPLREVIADYIRRTRGIHCDVEQVAVTSSVRLDLACRMLIDSGDVVAVENHRHRWIGSGKAVCQRKKISIALFMPIPSRSFGGLVEPRSPKFYNGLVY
jgi:GntR family transcriptional regulator/MocR family aminotransferase